MRWHYLSRGTSFCRILSRCFRKPETRQNNLVLFRTVLRPRSFFSSVSFTEGSSTKNSSTQICATTTYWLFVLLWKPSTALAAFSIPRMTPHSATDLWIIRQHNKTIITRNYSIHQQRNNKQENKDSSIVKSKKALQQQP